MAIEQVCFDLETSNLNANFGVVLCGVVKFPGKKPKVFRQDTLNKNWDKDRSDDKAVVEAIANELRTGDILVAHYGAKFDVPFLAARLAHWRLQPLGRKKLFDPFQVAKNYYRLSSNSLDSLCDFLKLKNRKTPVTGQLWVRAFLAGDRRAMNYIVDHCVKDVAMLDELVDNLKTYTTVFDSRGSGW